MCVDYVWQPEQWIAGLTATSHVNYLEIGPYRFTERSNVVYPFHTRPKVWRTAAIRCGKNEQFMHVKADSAQCENCNVGTNNAKCSHRWPWYMGPQNYRVLVKEDFARERRLRAEDWAFQLIPVEGKDCANGSWQSKYGGVHHAVNLMCGWPCIVIQCV